MNYLLNNDYNFFFHDFDEWRNNHFKLVQETLMLIIN